MVNHYDVFNGDADGICALHQLRMAYPLDTVNLITGVKRDITLLKRIEHVQNCRITVLDISMASNLSSLTRLLQQKNRIDYFDHHFAGEIPDNQLLHSHINQAPDICTSLLANSYVNNRYPLWAICGAFGDNLHQPATLLARTNQLSQEQIRMLCETGELLNYNGYGSTIEDLHLSPEVLYQEVHCYEDPFEFYKDSSTVTKLKNGYQKDLANCNNLTPLFPKEKNKIYQLPNQPWARRISGTFANIKAREHPTSAHAFMTANSDNTWRISVRAPLTDKSNADTLCKAFPTGGGRSAAAGINSLPQDMVEDFFKAFQSTYP